MSREFPDDFWFTGTVVDPLMVGEPDYQGDPLPPKGAQVSFILKTWHAWVVSNGRAYLFRVPGVPLGEDWVRKTFADIKPVAWVDQRFPEMELHAAMERAYEQCPHCHTKAHKFKRPLDIQMGLCKVCRTQFHNLLERIAAGDDLYIVDGTVWWCGPEPTGPIVYPNQLGLGGDRVTFIRGGVRRTTRNANCVGVVPPQLSDFLPDNAVRVP